MLTNRIVLQRIVALTIVAGAPSSMVAQDLAIMGGEVRTVSDGVFSRGAVLVRDGKIAAVGDDFLVPRGVEVIDATGMIVTPGFIDARTGLGVPPGARFDRAQLIRGDLSMAESLGSITVPGSFGQAGRAPTLHPWVTGGVTSVYVSPGAENLVGGFGAVVKLGGRAGGVAEVLSDAAGLSISFGDAAQRAFEAPTTRQGMIQQLRQWLIGVRDAGPSLRMQRVLVGEIPLRVVANVPDDIVTALRVFSR